MTRFLRMIFVLAIAAITSGPALAQSSETGNLSSRVPVPTSFLEACADKIEERGRLRFCGEYFETKLGSQADALLYLRDRITTLRASHEQSASEKYSSFLSAIYIVAFLTIVSIILVASERRIGGTAKWASIASSAALLVVIVIVAMGWLGKYRAEYAAQVELGILRDRMEAEAAQAIATGQEITPAMVTGWTGELAGIGRRFAENYTDASPFPELDRFDSGGSGN
ncbi:phenylalanyl-tRNA synthetase subunit alpha [Roseibium sp. RKSG952]|uniref:phenylalanyl-tRNA synthetase subunit alpha n=1 Tax=Roseibium sp. RKSG952 TaxID=2529384 RepID=UPI0012BBC454|nr:phenylalanyl-tRNA synthetase subunit alpha [Roseibium sp. RKSG952]MTI00043.1 phenylalanyl-tRNA synthetase subunit alpha [Roseibium sp. RKSG952]